MIKAITFLVLSIASTVFADCASGNCGRAYHAQQPSQYQGQNYYPRNQADRAPNEHYYDNNQINVSGKPTAFNERTTYGENASNVQKAEKKFPQDFGNSESDRVLNAKVRDKLSGWFTDYEGLTLNTTNGAVSISGYVSNVDDIKKINDKIKDINGIVSINNQVQVKSGK